MSKKSYVPKYAISRTDRGELYPDDLRRLKRGINKEAKRSETRLSNIICAIIALLISLALLYFGGH